MEKKINDDANNNLINKLDRSTSEVGHICMIDGHPLVLEPFWNSQILLVYQPCWHHEVKCPVRTLPSSKSHSPSPFLRYLGINYTTFT